MGAAAAAPAGSYKAEGEVRLALRLRSCGGSLSCSNAAWPKGAPKSAETAKKFRQYTTEIFSPPIWLFVTLFATEASA